MRSIDHDRSEKSRADSYSSLPHLDCSCDHGKAHGAYAALNWNGQRDAKTANDILKHSWLKEYFSILMPETINPGNLNLP